MPKLQGFYSTTKDTKDTMENTKEEFMNDCTWDILGVAMKVHTALGPGLLESAYAHCMCYEVTNAGFYVEQQKPIPLVYNEVKLDAGYRADIIVNKSVIVELKAVDGLLDIHLAQVLTYLKLTNLKLGLLINFNVVRLKEGIKRVIR